MVIRPNFKCGVPWLERRYSVEQPRRLNRACVGANHFSPLQICHPMPGRKNGWASWWRRERFFPCRVSRRTTRLFGRKWPLKPRHPNFQRHPFFGATHRNQKYKGGRFSAPTKIENGKDRDLAGRDVSRERCDDFGVFDDNIGDFGGAKALYRNRESQV